MLLTMAACVKDPISYELNYPTSWALPRITEDGGCPSLTGTYAYRGEAVGSILAGPRGSWHADIEKPEAIFSAAVLEKPQLAGQVERVILVHDAETGRLTATFEGDGLLFPGPGSMQAYYYHGSDAVLAPSSHIILSRVAYCIDGWITLSHRETGGNGESGSIDGKFRTSMMLAEDGSLIGRYIQDYIHSSPFGLSSQNFHIVGEWFRFPRKR